MIVLSAVPDLATAATRLKAAAWIAKPFRLDDLLYRVRQTLDLACALVGVEPGELAALRRAA